ncbi:MAG TPA: ATP-binding protein, partial [Verrucomicrobiae bacterium]|nr:ATP-binding protein [Verrucomicrobiae bacterium]
MERREPLAPLPAEALYRRCDSTAFKFKDTSELEDLPESIGQGRALEAIRFGIGIRRRGFNLYLMGPAGTGKFTTIRDILTKRAAADPTPDEWCYVNSFKHPDTPRVLRLRPGLGVHLRGDMDRLLESLRAAIPAAFETENYRARKQAIEQEVKAKQEKELESLQQDAGKNGVALLRLPAGLAFAPSRGGEVLSPDEFEQLPESERKKFQATVATFEERLQNVMRKLQKCEQEGREKLHELNHSVASFAVSHLIDEVRKRYSDVTEIVSYLDDVEKDVIQHVDEFLGPQEHPLAAMMGISLPGEAKGSSFFRRYRVNVIVEHDGPQGAPVVFEDNPTYQNLMGSVEYMAQLGALTTDFNLIRAGALHRANGGYLVLDAHKLLLQPYAWEALKRCLESSQIRIESLGQMLSLVATVSLNPEPIPLDVKVILLGERLLFYLLNAYDPEMGDLFKVAADFEEDMDLGADTNLQYARLLAGIAREESLLPFDAGAVGRVIEQSARLAGDSRKVLLRRRVLGDLLHEADYRARERKRPAVSAEHVQQAIDAQVRRSDRIRERSQELVVQGTVLIDTEGAKVGQVNGLSVVDLGGFAFGHPSRITARVRMGKGEVIDIEREVELSGPIHSKGVLILSGFLAGRYAVDQPLSLSATLVFEQSYAAVEGDSASSAELYALLSALSGVPIKQSLAVTGSVNQRGEIQAIGGVNEKIEGFFDLCKARGLSGAQGVIIPATNVRHLMLRQDVVDAVRASQFRIYA